MGNFPLKTQTNCTCYLHTNAHIYVFDYSFLLAGLESDIVSDANLFSKKIQTVPVFTYDDDRATQYRPGQETPPPTYDTYFARRTKQTATENVAIKVIKQEGSGNHPESGYSSLQCDKKGEINKKVKCGSYCVTV
jgi:hypothetical protein